MSSAGYRFVPISPQVIEPPVSFAALDLSKPLSGGSVSGEIAVTWTATAPVAVGEKRTADGSITPIRIGDHYCLPGPSLRGMIRSTLEIATFSHLGRINSWRHHGIRTYEPDPQPKKFEVLNQRGKRSPPLLHAGWLSLETSVKATRSDDQSPTHRWLLYPVAYGRISIADVLSKARPVLADSDWTTASATAKYKSMPSQFACSEFVTEQRPIGTTGRSETIYRFPKGAEVTRKDIVRVDGILVFTSSGDTKTHEVVFGMPNKRIQYDVTTVVAQFHRLHTDPGRTFEAANPRDEWRDWLCRTGYNNRLSFQKARHTTDPSVLADPPPGIPVFYIGTPKEENFFFGLSRVIRLPWQYSVGQVAQNIYTNGNAPNTYIVPKLDDPNGWDFARALFGEVEEANTAVSQTTRETHAPGGSNRTSALAGRVAFGFASATTDPQPGAAVTGILGTPRESFYPFYLRNKEAQSGVPDGATYDDAFAVPAGRKRYVVRQAVTLLPQGNGNENMGDPLHFLPAGTAFCGTIRFHNLHPVELGALLWALTFGEGDTAQPRYRHLLGRAKAYGYGALAARVNLKTPLRVSDGLDASKSIANYLTAFEAYMGERLRQPLKDHPAIQALSATADPAVGAAAEVEGQLGTLPMEGNIGYPKLKERFEAARIAMPKANRNQLPPLPPPNPKK